MTQERHRRSALGRTETLKARERQRETRNQGYEEMRYLPPQEEKKPRRHTLAWLLLALFSLAGIAAAAVLILPQVTGQAIGGLPRMAFVGQQLVTYDEAAVSTLASSQAEVAAADGVFGSGIRIDNVDVSGMTYGDALAAVEAVPAAGGGEFSVTVQIAGRTWTIDSTMVPMTRNVEEVVADAWAVSSAEPDPLPGETMMETRLRALREREQNPVWFQTELTFDREAIWRITEGIAAELEIPPVNAAIAGFDPATHNFTLSREQSGTSLNAAELYEAVLTELDHGNMNAVVQMEPDTLFAAVTVDDLAGTLGRISGYSTKTTNNKNRNTNIRLSAEAINGYCVQPGEEFSFNHATGQRTEGKGYKPATAISGGQNIEEVGGGVCQTSSTLFNAVARGNFEIVKRSPHAWPSSYVEKGLDATVNWPGLDFQWRNNTEYPVYIAAWYADRVVTVELYGVRLGEGITIDLESKVIKTLEKPTGIKEVYNPELPYGTRQTTVKARKGYVVETYQVWYHDGIEFKRELLCTSTYKAYQETVEYNQ